MTAAIRNDVPAAATPAAESPAAERPAAEWPAWQRALFRLTFVYLLLTMEPWTWLGAVPGLGAVTGGYTAAERWAVRGANAHLFHVRERLVENGYGSGDTSYAWARLWLFVALAVAGAAAWALAERLAGRRPRAYPRLLYWLRTLGRYWLAAAALSYGIIKLFALQMPFPTLSQLATPLGDFLPMRLSWMFLGYSHPYQTFSGAVEAAAGLLLLARRTVTLGLVVAAGAFLNVLLINLSYDVPVKLFAAHLALACAVLLALDAPRLWAFFVLNRAVPGTRAYDPPPDARPWYRWARRGAKAVFLVAFTGEPLAYAWSQARERAAAAEARPFRAGVYAVRRFARNADTLPPLLTDTLRWRDVIFDDAKAGSVGTADPLFWRRYGRGHFRYAADTARRTVALWRTSTTRDSVPLFAMRYALAGADTVRLWGRVRGDSVYAELVRTARRFPLAERQFHWVSEANR